MTVTDLNFKGNETVKEKEAVKKKLRILEVSACGNKQAEKKLKFQSGAMDIRITFLFRELLKKGTYELISVRDIPFHALKKLQRELSIYGYRMFIHKSWNTVAGRQRWRYTCLSALFVADGVEFEQIYSGDKFPTLLRYVAGRISFAGKEIFYKTSHFPCVDGSRSCIENQICRKTAMLEDEVTFQEAHQNDICISAGDFNGAPGGDFYGQEQFESFLFTDMVSENTYEDKSLDHVYVSKGLRETENLKLSVEFLEDYYMVLTDHKILSVELEAAGNSSRI